nr:intraflagellar transport protein 88 [Hymenolepis microstoma]
MPTSDDIYEFNDTDTSAFDLANIFNNRNVQAALKSANIGRWSASYAIPSSRMNTGVEILNDQSLRTESRSLISIRAAGFSCNRRHCTTFDEVAVDIPSTAVSFGKGECVDPSSPKLLPELDDSPEMKMKEIEKKITQLVEESCMAAARGDISDSLEKAKEASRKERALILRRQQLDVADKINLDLTYFVLLNVANRYEQSGLYQEALNTYQTIIANKVSPHAVGDRSNMKYTFQRLLKVDLHLDNEDRYLPQSEDRQYESILGVIKSDELWWFEKDKKAHAELVIKRVAKVIAPVIELNFNHGYTWCIEQTMNSRYLELQYDMKIDKALMYLRQRDFHKSYAIPSSRMNTGVEILNDQSLRTESRSLISIRAAGFSCNRRHCTTFDEVAVDIPSTAVSFGKGECVDPSSPKLLPELDDSPEMKMKEIEKKITQLVEESCMAAARGDISDSLEKAKEASRKERALILRRQQLDVADKINLDLTYFVLLNVANRYEQSGLYQEALNTYQTIIANKVSPHAALVNKGNILFKQAQLEHARDCYLEALQDDPTCVEALYNLGLAAKQMNRMEESLDAISKIHAILPANPLIIYQIMDIYDRIGNFEQSHDSFIQLQGLVPSDAFLLQYCGESFERIGDKSQAMPYYYDSFKYYPCNIDVIEWLAAYYVESQLYEKSITFIQQAVLMQPNEIKWQLMIASCYRKSDNLQQALEVYKKIHNKFPDSIECLQFLVRLQSDMDLSEADLYMTKLDKAIKLREAKEQRLLSASRRQSPNLSLVGRLNESRENISGGSFRSIRRCSTPFQTSRISKTPSNSSLRSLQDYLESERECEIRTPQGPSRRSVTPYTSIVNYSDPLGPTLDRLRTRTKNRNSEVNESADDVTNDDLFPE